MEHVLEKVEATRNEVAKAIQSLAERGINIFDKTTKKYQIQTHKNTKQNMIHILKQRFNLYTTDWYQSYLELYLPLLLIPMATLLPIAADTAKNLPAITRQILSIAETNEFLTIRQG